MFIVVSQVKESGEIAKLWKKRARLIAADPLKQKTWEDFPEYLLRMTETSNCFAHR